MEIREAEPADLPAIMTLYNHYVRTSTCTYQTDPWTADEVDAWYAEHDAAHPVTVAIDGDELVGWGALSWFRHRWGYRFTAGDTVYVRPARHRRGIGRALLADLVERARNLGHRTIIAGISAEQDGSIRLHEALGFTPAGALRQVGTKFDAWLD